MQISNKPQQNRTISQEEAMKMNRRDRRRLGKENGVKIVGSNTDHIKPEDKPFALTTFTGKRK
jgi:hypothetical protein